MSKPRSRTRPGPHCVCAEATPAASRQDSEHVGRRRKSLTWNRVVAALDRHDACKSRSAAESPAQGQGREATQMTKTAAAFLLMVTGVLPARGQGYDNAGDDLAHGRIRYVEPGIAVQRPDEAGAEEATPNTPFLPGDRVWSDGSGRAELQFPDGSALRLDRRSKLDYLEHESGRSDE